MVQLLNLLYQICLAFCFGGTNALVISLMFAKGTEQGYLSSLFNPLKKALFLVLLIALGLNIYLLRINTTLFILSAILVNTIVGGIILEKRWKVPTPNQIKIMSLSGFVSLLLWYVVLILGLA
ncbi:hypothetical protein A3K63_04855 [Candidatus Micrarchaeota archaeon RBG_16_49_10]|nr:MAG: hypothetical protein A3K63_04855 [Candidatus Micrarchaeota archaeon RBG_16_49_10]